MLKWTHSGSAHQFVKDLAGRLAHRVQLTTDGHAAYLSAVEKNFGGDIDYAMLVKMYGATRETEARYSPADCIACQRKEITEFALSKDRLMPLSPKVILPARRVSSSEAPPPQE